MTNILSEDILWKKYEHEVDIHRGYLDLVIKINTFYYAITGAILSFYFLHIKNEPLIQYALVLPFLMSVGLAIFFIRSAFASRFSHDEIANLAAVLNFQTFSVVAKVLEFLLWVFAVLMIIVAVGIVILFFKVSLTAFL